MGRKRSGIPGLSFSWKRAIGLSAAKGRLSRQIGVPLTKSGRQKKMGRALGCAIPLFFLVAGFGVAVFFAVGTISEPVHAADKSIRTDAVRVDGIDYLVDWRMLSGKDVNVGPCSVVLANDLAFPCAIGALASSPGGIGIDAGTLNREALRRALRECQDFTARIRCLAIGIVGTVREKYPGQPMMTNADIVWAAP